MREVAMPMKPPAWMTGVSLGSWLLVSLAPVDANPEVFLGMAGPLAIAVASWLAIVRVHAVAPERVMGVMVGAMGAKMLFFGAYVAVVIRALEARTVPFVASFTLYFIALYAMEALFLKRLFAHGPSRPS